MLTKKEKVKCIQNVIKVIENVLNILNILQNIINKGYDEDILYNIQIELENENDNVNEGWKILSKNNIIIKSSEKKILNGIQSLLEYLKDIEKELDSNKTKFYKNNETMRFIFGRQFNKIYKYVESKYLKKETDSNKIKYENDIFFINKYITNNNLNENIKYNPNTNKINKENNIFEIINDYIEQLMNNCDKNNLYNNTLIKKKITPNSGFITYHTQNPEIDILRIFLYLTENPPMAQNVLICNYNTTIEEIYSFLYRAFLDNENKLYIIINTDVLNIEKANKLILIIKELLQEKNEEKMKSLLLFLTKNDTSDLSEQIRELNGKKIIELKEMRNESEKMIEKIKELKNYIQIIHSYKPGVGKSNYIKDYFEKKKKNYIYFPVGGDLNLEELTERLKISVKKGNVGLHIDIYDCDNEEILEIINQFLFSFLIMNYYSFNENILFIKDNEIEINVELPANFDGNLDKFPILYFFNEKIIYKISIEEFKIYSINDIIKQMKKIKSLKNRNKLFAYNDISKLAYDNNNIFESYNDNKSIFSFENELYFQEDDEKKQIEKGNYSLIIPKTLSKNVDLIFNYIKIPMNVDSNMQIICNYFYLLEKNLIDKVNIFIFDISNYKQINLEVLKNTKVTPEYINYLKNKYIFTKTDDIKSKSKNNINKKIKKNKNNDKITTEIKNKNIVNIQKIQMYKKILLSTNLLNSIPENECRNLLKKYFLGIDSKKDKTISLYNNTIEFSQNLSMEINNIKLNQSGIINIDNNKEIQIDTFYQIISFVDLFAYQLKHFGTKKIFYISHLETLKKDIINEIKEIRTKLVESLKENSMICSKSAFNSILKMQNEALIEQNIDIDRNNEIEKKKVEKKLSEMETFNDIIEGRDLIILKERNDGISIISDLGNKEKREQLFKEDSNNNDKFYFLNLLNSFNSYQEKDIINIQSSRTTILDKSFQIDYDKYDNPIIFDYDKLPQNAYIKEIIDITCSLNEEDEEELGEKYIDDLESDYVFTKDNFTKMVMINLRMNARVPLIIMGETGCGKTSLIRALASLKRAEMIIFNIHAGIDNNKILEFMRNNNLLEENVDTFKKSFEKIKDIWVFLDEFNTSNSIGLFSEIMIKRSVLGKPIKKNVSFIAACNPYKKSDDFFKKKSNLNEIKQQAGISANILNNKNKRVLAYNVNPLPFSLLNYVFSFGQLNDTNGNKYINNMVEQSIITQINYDENIKKLKIYHIKSKINSLKKRISDAIIIAHSFVKKEKGTSSVSLRDVNRLIRLFEWLLKKRREEFLSINYDKLKEEKDEYIIKLEKEKKTIEEYQKKIKEIDNYDFATILGLYVCYFFRLDTRELRDTLNKKLSEYFQIFDFEIICKNVVKHLVNEIEIEKGISKNKKIYLHYLYVLIIKFLYFYVVNQVVVNH